MKTTEVCNISGFTAEDKKKLFTLMGAYEMTHGTAYNRFFRDGFRAWEEEGILNIIKDYAPKYKGSPCEFWKSLPSKKEFVAKMVSKGMSRKTVFNRFKLFNFKKYELKGINKILEEL